MTKTKPQHQSHACKFKFLASSPWPPLMLFILIITTNSSVASAKVSAIIVFGDSSVDAGNNNQISTVLRSNFQPYGRDFFGGKSTGRFSNGRIPPDFISAGFGLKSAVPAYLDPAYNISDFADGVCFASAGTGFDNSTSAVLNVLPLWKEVEYYKEYQTKLRSHLGPKKANRIIHEALYIVSLGTNDFLENYYSLPRRRSQYTPEQYQQFILGVAENFIKQIYSLGARKISFTGLPPMGCLPLERTSNYIGGNGDGCIERYNKVALDFNDKLNGMIKNMNAQLKGMKMVFSNPYFILQDIVQKPSNFGFEVAGVACCATGLFEMGYMCDRMNPYTCTDASKYVFWDSFHPTEKTNQIVVDYLFKNVLKQFL